MSLVNPQSFKRLKLKPCLGLDLIDPSLDNIHFLITHNLVPKLKRSDSLDKLKKDTE